MVEIIPVILVKEFAEALARIQAVERAVDWMQIDVVDGVFAPNVTWGDPEALRSVDTHLRFEIDLMVADPKSAVGEWIKAAPRVGRIYFHQETVSVKETHAIIAVIKEAGVEAGISINPRTPVEVLHPFVTTLDAVLFLGVAPGFSGAQFQENVIGKVHRFHEQFPHIPITVDGGVRVGLARKLAEAGAVRLAASTSIFDFDAVSAEEEVAALKRDVKGF